VTAADPPVPGGDLVVLAAAAWPALEQTELGGWLLRAAGGVTGRANSALRLSPEALPADDVLGAVEDFYDARLLPPRVQVHDADTDEALSRRGWTATGDTDLLVGELPPAPPGAPPALVVPGPPDDAWLGCWWAVDGRGGPRELDVARRLLAAVRDPVGSAAVVDDGRTVGVARGVVQGGWLGVFAVAVLPEARRRGVARALLGALREWGDGQGARAAYLQVARDNAPARALYAGLRPAASYRYRTRTHG
jgi:GNAT superfamily N-acetyltransferase